MNVRISSQLEEMVQQKVKSGLYGDESDVVEEALRLMQEQDRRAEELSAAVAEGFAQVERGESIELTAERMEQIMQRAAENARMGKAVKDVVKP